MDWLAPCEQAAVDFSAQITDCTTWRRQDTHRRVWPWTHIVWGGEGHSDRILNGPWKGEEDVTVGPGRLKSEPASPCRSPVEILPKTPFVGRYTYKDFLHKAYRVLRVVGLKTTYKSYHVLHTQSQPVQGYLSATH